MAILSFNTDEISSGLQFNLPRQIYRELIEMLKVKITVTIVIEFIHDIESFLGPLDKLEMDSRLTQKLSSLMKPFE